MKGGLPASRCVDLASEDMAARDELAPERQARRRLRHRDGDIRLGRVARLWQRWMPGSAILERYGLGGEVVQP
jgi:hypothetical protein